MLEGYIRGRGKRPLLMTHLVVGYPSIDDNLAMLEEMREGGSDLVELQFPFSEPVADGPVFVRANQASLERGTRVADCFGLMRRGQAFGLPLLMMGYYNTVFRLGEQAFCERLAGAGGRGFIIPDLPPELGAPLRGHAARFGLSPIPLLSPNTTPERKREVCSLGGGFVYCVARKGVTGSRTRLDEGVDEYLRQVRAATGLPLALGFGVRERADLDFLAGRVEIAVMGTAVLEAWEAGGRRGLRELLHRLRA